MFKHSRDILFSGVVLTWFIWDAEDFLKDAASIAVASDVTIIHII